MVTHGQGLKWLQVTLTGKEAHTGSAPMPQAAQCRARHGRVIDLVDESGDGLPADAVGAVGHIEVYPNSRNIIAGQAVFTIDIRSPDKATLDEMDRRIRRGVATIAEALAIGAEIEEVGHFDPVTFDEGCVTGDPRRRERSAYRTATSSPVPATMPAGSTGWRRRPW